MKLSSDEERWAVWMVQARRFAARENFTDAVARMRLVRDAVAKALGEATDSHRQEQLEIELARAEEQLAILESKYLAWRSEIAARRQATIDQAEEEMARPLPEQVN
jgi:predicted  nucleic acid-binding Zn-ribbon protein